MKSLKSMLRFWQEIFFIIPMGIILIVMVSDVFMRQTSMFDDGLGIATFCFLLILFICLIGQLFWKNEVVSLCITPLLVLYSLFWIFVSFAMPKYIAYDIPNPNNHLRPVILIVALFLLFAAITMPRKYMNKTSI
jgi:hypothetical protein